MLQNSNAIILSDDILKQIDLLIDRTPNRSEFVESILRKFLLKSQTRRQQDLRDLEIINHNAEYLNQEAEDVLEYQIEL